MDGPVRAVGTADGVGGGLGCWFRQESVSIDRAVREQAYLPVFVDGAVGLDWLVSFALRRRVSEDGVGEGGRESMSKRGETERDAQKGREPRAT